MGIHTPDRLFCGISPEDDNIDFWSKHFNEYVYRLVTEGKILGENAKRFFQAEKGFMTENISSHNGFQRGEVLQHLIQ